MINPATLFAKWKGQKNPWLKWGVFVFMAIAVVAIIAYRIVTFQAADDGILGRIKTKIEKGHRAKLLAAKKRAKELDRQLAENSRARQIEHEKRENDESDAEKLRERVRDADGFDDINDAISDAARRRNRP